MKTIIVSDKDFDLHYLDSCRQASCDAKSTERWMEKCVCVCVYMLTEEAADDLGTCVKLNLFLYLCCIVSRYMNVDAVWYYFQRWSVVLSIAALVEHMCSHQTHLIRHELTTLTDIYHDK